MSEETTHDTGLNPLGKWLVIGIVVVVVMVVVYAILNSGIDVAPVDVGSSGGGANNPINVEKLREEARPTPTPFTPVTVAPVHLVEPPPQPMLVNPQSMPRAASAPRQLDAMGQWRLKKRMEALEAPVMVAAFERDHRVQEIPSQADIGGTKDGAAPGQARLRAPVSPYTIMEGSHINAILVSGINSDFPGLIVGQIESPLYDTATGRYLLIPAGARVIGTFRTPEGYQDRVQVAWHRLIFPDTSSLDLPQMPATDPQGYAGATDKVDSHYLATFGTAALMSLLTAGQSLGSIATFGGGQVSGYSGGVYQTNPFDQSASMASSNAAQQLGQTGNQFLQRGANRPKTITIRPGFVFDIFVSADLVLPGPYQDNAGALASTAQNKE